MDLDRDILDRERVQGLTNFTVHDWIFFDLTVSNLVDDCHSFGNAPQLGVGVIASLIKPL
jgi:hypothetical protein